MTEAADANQLIQVQLQQCSACSDAMPSYIRPGTKFGLNAQVLRRPPLTCRISLIIQMPFFSVLAIKNVIHKCWQQKSSDLSRKQILLPGVNKTGVK